MLKFVRNAWLWIAVGVIVASGSIVGAIMWMRRHNPFDRSEHPTHV